MNTAIRTLSLMALCCTATGLAAAQQPTPPTAAPSTARPPAEPDASAVSGTSATPGAKPTKSTAQSEAGEPRADTSNPPTGAAVAGPPPAASPAPTVGSTPSAGARTAPAARTTPAPASGQKSGAKVDRLDLGTATVTGDREQPKVMYIVPWKRSDIGDLAGKPMNSLVDEILAPVDRDVFKREVVYYQAVQATASQNGAPPKPAQQGEK
jgi:hypothetical protein